MLNTAKIRNQARKPIILFEDVGTPERAVRNGGIIKRFEPKAANSRVMVCHVRAKYECQLDEYLAKGKLCLGEFNAGMKFRTAYLTKAVGIKTRDSSVESFGGCGSASDAIDRLTISERTLNEAYTVMHDAPMQLLVVVAVCGNDEPAGSTAKVDTLRRALDRLQRFWKIA